MRRRLRPADICPARNTSRSRKNFARRLCESSERARTDRGSKNARMDMEAVSGEELQTLTARLMTQPAPVIQRVKKVLEN